MSDFLEEKVLKKYDILLNLNPWNLTFKGVGPFNNHNLRLQNIWVLLIQDQTDQQSRTSTIFSQGDSLLVGGHTRKFN